MFESGEDQAAGLRQLFGNRDVRVLPVAGNDLGGGQSGCVVNLAAALARMGRRTLVLDGDRALIAPTLGLKARFDLVHLLHGDRRFDEVAVRANEGFWVLPAARGLSELMRSGASPEALFSGFGALTEPFDTILLCASTQTIAHLLARRSQETTLVCGTDPRQLAATYSRIKALSDHGLTRFRVIYNRSESPSAAAACHERLAGTAGRFLKADVAFGGSIEDEGVLSLAERSHSTVFTVASRSEAARSFERIALSSLDWPVPVYRKDNPSLH